MKTTDHFKDTIKSYLDKRAETDELFAPKYANDKKNIDDCIIYILNTVQKSGCNGFTDDEVYGIAVHYYDEESIDIGKEISCRVAVNHTVELTDEEKKDAKQKAMDKLIDEEAEKMKRKSDKKTIQKDVEQPSLF